MSITGSFSLVSSFGGTLTGFGGVSGSLSTSITFSGDLTDANRLIGDFAATSTWTGTPTGFGALVGTFACATTFHTIALPRVRLDIDDQPFVSAFRVVETDALEFSAT